jgi:hypothetical protein
MLVGVERRLPGVRPTKGIFEPSPQHLRRGYVISALLGAQSSWQTEPRTFLNFCDSAQRIRLALATKNLDIRLHGDFGEKNLKGAFLGKDRAYRRVSRHQNRTD